MSGYLLNWNPEKSEFREIASLMRLLEDGKLARSTWSIGSRKSAEINAPVVLLRQGVEPRGVVGIGRIVSESFAGPHWDPDKMSAGIDATRVVVSFVDLLDATDESTPPLKRDAVPANLERFWQTQQSGSEITESELDEFLDLWEEHRGASAWYRRSGGCDTVHEALARKEGPGDAFVTQFSEALRLLYLPRSDDNVESDLLNELTPSAMNEDAVTPNTETASHRFRLIWNGRFFRFGGQVSPTDLSSMIPSASHNGSESTHEPDQSSYSENRVRMRMAKQRERNRKVRALCLQYYGERCLACEMTFSSKYGLSRECIEVHHIRPLASRAEIVNTHPIDDLIPLCPNCHAAVHAENPMLSLDELRKRLIV